MIGRLIGAFGGVSGALGVTFLAMGAHRSGGASLITAGQMLLFHAPLLLGYGFFLRVGGRLREIQPMIGLKIGILALIVGLSLFCGDLAARVLLGGGLFPMAAPIGGSLLIAGWIILALSSLFFRPA